MIVKSDEPMTDSDVVEMTGIRAESLALISTSAVDLINNSKRSRAASFSIQLGLQRALAVTGCSVRPYSCGVVSDQLIVFQFHLVPRPAPCTEDRELSS